MSSRIARAEQGDRLDDEDGWALWVGDMLIAVCRSNSVATSLAAALDLTPTVDDDTKRDDDAKREVLDELDKRFAKLDERIAARIAELATRFGTIGQSMERMADAQVEAEARAQQGILDRHRMNLASMCYGIRLKAVCALVGTGATGHRVYAELAVADADALIAALAAPRVP